MLERPWQIRNDIAMDRLYRDGVEEIRQWPLQVIVNPSLTSEQIRDEVIHGEPDFVIVDHIHRFRWGRERRDLEEQIQVLTNLSLDYNIPVMVLAQLRRFQTGGGFEKFPMPTAQDFKETGALEQESAMQIAVWRQRDEAGARYAPSGHTLLLVLKDRHGPLREILLTFDGERQVFLPITAQPLVTQSEGGTPVAWHPTA
jgi:replicative DNA helicase